MTEPKLEVDSQAKEVADVDHEKEEAVKEEVTEKTRICCREGGRGRKDC